MDETQERRMGVELLQCAAGEGTRPVKSHSRSEDSDEPTTMTS